MTSSNTPVAFSKDLHQPIHIKLVLLGEAAVGKSSLVLRYVNNDFKENKEPTIGAAFLTKKLSFPVVSTSQDGNGEENSKNEPPTLQLKYEIWDTAGQERFHSLAPMYYRNSHAAIVVYDVTQEDSLIKAKKWIAELQRHANPNIIIAIVGNKIDLAQGLRSNAAQEAESIASENSLLCFETSAKTGKNINELFHEIGSKILANESIMMEIKRREEMNASSANASSANLSSPTRDADQSKRCCQ